MDFTSASANGQRFVYADSGEGPLALLLHGFPDTPHGWEHTCDTLVGAGYRTVVPYLRGYHPDTIMPGRGSGGEETAADVIHLLDAIGAEQAALVGHDWGASITYRAAATAPERIRAICAIAIPHPRLLKPSPGLLWRARHFVTLRLPTGNRLMRRRDFAYVDALMRRWAPNWTGPDRDATAREVKRCFADTQVLDAALSYYRQVSRESLPRLSQPALIVGGTTDIIDAQLFSQACEAFEGPCDVLVAPGAGHWPHREAPELFEQRLLAFLEGSLQPR
jgi:pimeloyl-ACP methyl ester carboxylesterase